MPAAIGERKKRTWIPLYTFTQDEMQGLRPLGKDTENVVLDKLESLLDGRRFQKGKGAFKERRAAAHLFVMHIMQVHYQPFLIRLRF